MNINILIGELRKLIKDNNLLIGQLIDYLNEHKPLNFKESRIIENGAEGLLVDIDLDNYTITLRQLLNWTPYPKDYIDLGSNILMTNDVEVWDDNECEYEGLHFIRFNDDTNSYEFDYNEDFLDDEEE